MGATEIGMANFLPQKDATKITLIEMAQMKKL